MKMQWIGEHSVVFTDDVHSFGTDAVLLSDFSAPEKRDRVLEFGTGCGIVSLLWLRDPRAPAIDVLDVQPEAIALVQAAVVHDALQERLHPYCMDLRQAPELLGKKCYDLVVMNPPYQADGNGEQNAVPGRAVARHEILCSFGDICNTAAQLLNFGGKFCLCHRPDRLTDVLCALREAGLEPKRIRFCQQRVDKAPNLFLLEAKAGAKPGLVVEPPLLLQTEDGIETAEIKRIYHDYYLQRERNQ